MTIRTSILGSVISIAIFMSSASAKATRVLTPAGHSLQHFITAREHELTLAEVISKNRLGIDYEEAWVVSQARDQALKYLSYRSNPTPQKRLEFLTTCDGRQILSNPFCQLDVGLLREPAKSISTVHNPETLQASEAQIHWAREDFDYFTNLPMAALHKFFRQVPLEDLQKPAANLALTKTCNYAELQSATASKLEEYFPTFEAMQLSQRLYISAGACGSAEVHVKSQYRAALIAIWQKQFSNALALLAPLEQKITAGPYLARVAYWRHYSSLQLGASADAKVAQEWLYRNSPFSFFNLAVNGVDQRILSLAGRTEKPRVQTRSVVYPEVNSALRAVETLLRLKQSQPAMELAQFITSKSDYLEPEVKLYWAALLDRMSNSIDKFKVLGQLFQDAPRMISKSTLQLMFPAPYLNLIAPQLKQKLRHIDPLLILSLIRQESAFNHNAQSRVGARGLMQVMPATARSIASVSRRKLSDPATNIKLGTQYFAKRLEYFVGDVEYTLAAYNAGPNKIDDWRKRYPTSNKILFLELIPYHETRDYVISILRNYYWYSLIYPSGDKLTLKASAIIQANSRDAGSVE